MLQRLGPYLSSRSIGPLLETDILLAIWQIYYNERHALFVRPGKVCDVDREDDVYSEMAGNREEDKETEDIP